VSAAAMSTRVTGMRFLLGAPTVAAFRVRCKALSPEGRGPPKASAAGGPRSDSTAISRWEPRSRTSDGRLSRWFSSSFLLLLGVEGGCVNEAGLQLALDLHRYFVSLVARMSRPQPTEHETCHSLGPPSVAAEGARSLGRPVFAGARPAPTRSVTCHPVSPCPGTCHGTAAAAPFAPGRAPRSTPSQAPAITTVTSGAARH
jgi:hypothetical protein